MNKKQMLVIALVLVIITAGVLQYTYGRNGFSSRKDQDERLGEAVYVDNMKGEITNLINENDKAEGDISKENQQASDKKDYFVQARLEKEAIRSRRKEELQELTSGKDTSGELTAKAQQELLDLINRSEIEVTIESLIKQRGFEDVYVILGANGSVDLVVKADSLSQDQTAQISDIVLRHAGVEMKDIHIRNMN